MTTLTILFVTSEYKGEPMLQAAKEMGCRVLLLAEEKLRHSPWHYENIDEIFFTPSLARYQDVIHTVSYLCRERTIDHILPLDEFEVEIVAMLREHLRLPGAGVTEIRRFRDKLVMRQETQAAGIAVPEFVQLKHYPKVHEYMQTVPAPWILKPRAEAGSLGIRKIHEAEQLWQALRELGDKQSYYLLERFIPGDVFHVDSLWVNGKIRFVSPQQYGKPPFDVYHGGGVFNTRTIAKDSELAIALLDVNDRVCKTLGVHHGVTHAEFIRAHDDGTIYFLEVAARVGGAFVSDLIEQATGVNLWYEWGRLEVALMQGDKYKLPKVRKDFGGLIVTLAKQEHPDLSAYTDPEIVWRANKPYHAAMIVRSADEERVKTLLDEYAGRFAQDFMDVKPPMGTQRTANTLG